MKMIPTDDGEQRDKAFMGKLENYQLAPERKSALNMLGISSPLNKRGLWDNIHAKRKRIKAGSNEKMRKPGSKGAPTAKAFKKAAKTARKRK